MILSSADISTADILTTYYTRQAAEQIFDIGKHYSNLEPARVHDEEQLRGHLLITFIATVIVRIFQKEAIKAKKNMQDMLADLRNQFCKLFNDGAVTICEPQKSANDCYKMLKLPCPIAIDAGQLRSPNMPSGT